MRMWRMIVSKGEHQTSNGGNISMAQKSPSVWRWRKNSRPTLLHYGGVPNKSWGYPPNHPWMNSHGDDWGSPICGEPSDAHSVALGRHPCRPRSSDGASVACGSSSGIIKTQQTIAMTQVFIFLNATKPYKTHEII